MKLAIFGDGQLGVVDPAAGTVTDASAAVPGHQTGDQFGAGWWVRMCRDFDRLRDDLRQAAADGQPRSLDSCPLRAPVLCPSKIVAAAKNNAAHVAEMEQMRIAWGDGPPEDSDFDVFLKAPSSIIGPGAAVVLPAPAVAAGKEVHYEPELAVVIGRQSRNLTVHNASDAILGYLVGLDMTVRGKGDRSRRKSYDTFTPLGPWLTTADEVADPDALDIALSINGEPRQQATTRDLLVTVAGVVAYCSQIMTLEPGDVILTGAPAGVGPVHPGDRITTSISSLDEFSVDVAAPEPSPSGRPA